MQQRVLLPLLAGVIVAIAAVTLLRSQLREQHAEVASVAAAKTGDGTDTDFEPVEATSPEVGEAAENFRNGMETGQLKELSLESQSEFESGFGGGNGGLASE